MLWENQIQQSGTEVNANESELPGLVLCSFFSVVVQSIKECREGLLVHIRTRFRWASQGSGLTQRRDHPHANKDIPCEQRQIRDRDSHGLIKEGMNSCYWIGLKKESSGG